MAYFIPTVYGGTTGFAAGGRKGLLIWAAIGFGTEWVQYNLTRPAEKKLLRWAGSKLGQGRLGTMARDAWRLARGGAPIAAGVAIGVATTTIGLEVAEKTGLVQEGSADNYLEKHTSLSGLNEIYNPINIYKNFRTVWSSLW